MKESKEYEAENMERKFTNATNLSRGENRMEGKET